MAELVDQKKLSEDLEAVGTNEEKMKEEQHEVRKS